MTPAWQERPFWWSVGVSTFVAVGFALWMLTGLGGTGVTTWIDDRDPRAAAAVAGVVCLWVGHRHRGREGRAWAVLGISALLWAAGQAVWSWYEVIQGVSVPFPSAADAGFLLAVPVRCRRRVVVPGGAEGPELPAAPGA